MEQEAAIRALVAGQLLQTVLEADGDELEVSGELRAELGRLIERLERTLSDAESAA